MVQISQDQARLPKHIRLTVYNFLSAKDTFDKAASLSKQERESVAESAIARQGKVLKLNLAKAL